MGVEDWMLSIDGKVVIHADENDFLKAVGCLCGAYYTFNIKYDTEAISTLEFLQRLEIYVFICD